MAEPAKEAANIVTRLDEWDKYVGHGTDLFKAAKDEIERLRAALINLYDYCEDHDWGTIPVGKTIEGAEDLVRELRVNEQITVKEKE